MVLAERGGEEGAVARQDEAVEAVLAAGGLQGGERGGRLGGRGAGARSYDVRGGGVGEGWGGGRWDAGFVGDDVHNHVGQVAAVEVAQEPLGESGSILF